MDQTTVISILVLVAAIVVSVLYQVRNSLIQWVGKGMFQIVLGGLLLFVFNLLGATFNLHIPLNLVTIGVAGLLGIPGIISLFVIKILIF